MLAIILDGENTYTSPVFAMKGEGLRTEMIAFNASYTELRKIKYWKSVSGAIKRQIFVVQWTDFACKQGPWQGLDWVVGNRKLQKAFQFKTAVSVQDYPQFQPYAHKVDLPEWFEIQTREDAESLINVSLGFHDATLLRAEQGESDLEILFDTSWGCYITLQFLDILEADIIDKVGMVLDSEMELEADGIRWTVTDGFGGWTDGIDYSVATDGPFVKSKRVRWKIQITK